jgi:DNA (cytosine-5)-methyltransferase 1
MPDDQDALFDFVDLFAGIGGFHIALGDRWGGLGGRCVLASELDRAARQVYRSNFQMPVKGDIRKILALHRGESVIQDDEDDDLLLAPVKLPSHDVLAAGFPCQPFSKSGRQAGLEDQTRGTLFFDICEILKARRPRFIVLENVRNIAAHDEGRTWAVIVERLHELGYKVNSTPLVFSPHLLHPDQGGAPQFRERVFLLGEHSDYNSQEPLDWDFHVPNQPVGDWRTGDWDLKQWLKEHPALEDDLTAYRWDERSARFQHAVAWGELLAKLPFPGRIPQPLQVYEWKDRPELEGLPGWKQRHNILNSAFYLEHKAVIKPWLRKHRPDRWIKSDQKFEWQAQDADRMSPDDLFDLQIQFRPSGLRVKKPTYTGALVAITQTPYMGWLGRSLTPTEGASLQGIPVHDSADPYRLHRTAAVAFKQLGNGVNAGVVRHLTRALFDRCGYTGYRHCTLEGSAAPARVVDLTAADNALPSTVELTGSAFDAR